MIYYYTLFTVFAIVLTMMVVDPNVSDYIVLSSKLIKNKIERIFWMMRFHPVILSSPIGKWWMMRKYMRTAEELAQELSQKGKDGV
jgi:hypothetical protein